MRRLANRVGKDGVMRVISQQTRSQAENKELAIEHFAELLRDALKQIPIRKKDTSEQGGETPPAEGEEAARYFEKREVEKGPHRGLGER